MFSTVGFRMLGIHATSGGGGGAASSIVAQTMSQAPQCPLPAGAAANDWVLIHFYSDPGSLNLYTPTGSGTLVTLLDDNHIIGAFSTLTERIFWYQLTSTDISNGYIEINPSTFSSSSGIIIQLFQGAGYSSNSAVLENNGYGATSDSVTVSPGTDNCVHVFTAFIDDDLTTVVSYPDDYPDNQEYLAFGGSGSGGTMAVCTSETLPTGNGTLTFASSDLITGNVVSVDPSR